MPDSDANSDNARRLRPLGFAPCLQPSGGSRFAYRRRGAPAPRGRPTKGFLGRVKSGLYVRVMRLNHAG